MFYGSSTVDLRSKIYYYYSVYCVENIARLVHRPTKRRLFATEIKLRYLVKHFYPSYNSAMNNETLLAPPLTRSRTRRQPTDRPIPTNRPCGPIFMSITQFIFQRSKQHEWRRGEHELVWSAEGDFIATRATMRAHRTVRPWAPSSGPDVN